MLRRINARSSSRISAVKGVSSGRAASRAPSRTRRAWRSRETEHGALEAIRVVFRGQAAVVAAPTGRTFETYSLAIEEFDELPWNRIGEEEVCRRLCQAILQVN